MKTLSIRAPWTHFILHEGKDIENRPWLTHYRGPILIHQGKWWKEDEVLEDIETARREVGRSINWATSLDLDRMKALGGHIIGQARIVDCVEASDSPWFAGWYGFVLADAKPLPKPFPFKGQLSLFEVPEDLLQDGGGW